jgi:hypothetical protein
LIIFVNLFSTVLSVLRVAGAMADRANYLNPKEL